MCSENIGRAALGRKLTALRREFHRYPESAWTEFRTTARIMEELEGLGLPVKYGAEIHVPEKMYGLPAAETLRSCLERAEREGARPEFTEAMKGGFTGCVTEITGALPGSVTGIRVDIDCNDVEEASCPEHRPAAEGFRSVHPGCMHACGHDAHAAIGIGAAALLAAAKERLKGKVILAFQPAEEGARGAASFAAAGIFSCCDYFFGLHVGILPGMETGTAAAGVHGFLSSTKFDVTIRGAASHAGKSPEEGRNALAAAAAAVTNMLAIPRHHDGASRINIGTLRAGTGRNVIPAEAVMQVETRGATADINRFMEASAVRICNAAAEMYGCTAETRFMGCAGSADCDPELVRRTAEILKTVPGVKKVLTDADFGAGEDVTALMNQVQAHGGEATELLFCMPLPAPHHSSRFDVDERVILPAAEALAALALKLPETP